MSKITVTVTFTEKELREMLISSQHGIEILDKPRMKKIMSSPKFARNLGLDLKHGYRQSCEDAPSYELLEFLDLDRCVIDTTQYS